MAMLEKRLGNVCVLLKAKNMRKLGRYPNNSKSDLGLLPRLDFVRF